MTLRTSIRCPAEGCGAHLYKGTRFDTSDETKEKGEWVNTLKCENCNYTRDRREYTPGKEQTPSQTEALAAVERVMLDVEANKLRPLEIKAKKVEMLDTGRMMVSLTVGGTNDAGTMAEHFCRDTSLFIVTRHGAINVYSDEKKKFIVVKPYQLRYGTKNIK